MLGCFRCDYSPSRKIFEFEIFVTSMMSSHELFGFMSPALASEILDGTAASDKETYRAISAAVAESRKLRPVFFEKKPRSERNAAILEALAKPRLEPTAEMLLRQWLLKNNKSLLVDFLNEAGIPHKEGVIDDMPEKIDPSKLKAGVEKILANHPKERVIIYLTVFYRGNKENAAELGEMLEKDERLHLA
jgi:hypothetical protein